MRSIRTGFVVLALVAVLVAGGAGGAAASSFIPTVTSGRTQALSTSVNFVGDLDPYYVTPIAYDATVLLRMIDQSTPYPHETLFTNLNMASEFGQVKKVNRLQDLIIRTPDNGSYGFVYGNTDYKRLVLLDPVTCNGSVTLPVGSILIAMSHRAYYTGDYNDFVFAISKEAPTVTPVPGAVWLLGSGLAGLLALRRKRSA